MATAFTDVQASITSTVQSPTVNVNQYGTLSFMAEVSLATAGTLDITVQWSLNGSDWSAASTPDAFAQITTTTGGYFLSEIPVRAPFVRLNYAAVTGPYSFVISAVGI